MFLSQTTQPIAKYLCTETINMFISTTALICFYHTYPFL